MFNFQKEVVINTWDEKKSMCVPGVSGKIDDKVRFHDGGEYFVKYIVENKIYKTKPVTGENFELEITVPEGLLGQHIQVLIELGLDSDYRGDYGSALYYFRKPILVDVVLPEDGEAAAALLEKAIKAVIPAEYKFVTVASEDNKVTITGADSYQKVRSVVINRYDCAEGCVSDREDVFEYARLSGSEMLEGTDDITYTPNNVEFGTYAYLLHNLRLPTYENYRFTSPSAVEMPVPGTNYVQYTFAYCVPRVGLGGMSAAGQTIHSTTLHTFYVNEAYADKFEQLFTDAGFEGDFVDHGRETHDHNVTILPDNYASSQDLAAAAANAAQETAIADKADKSYVDAQLATKQDKD